MNTKRKEIVVVVHDAGGAEVIGAYMRTRIGKEIFHAYGAGPAVRVFRRLGLPLHPIKDDPKSIARIMEKYRTASYALIAAPGWMTKIEIRALLAAKRAGIKTVVYMDSWTDERKRFGYPKKNWQQHEPGEFWAGDRYALANIRREFPHVPVRSVPNQYFVEEIRRFNELKKNAPAPDAILFMSTIGGDSHKLLSELLHKLAPNAHHPRLRIRFHPGDDRARYDALITRFKGKIHVEKSNEKDIVKDLLRARVVLGAETMALVIAVLCKVRTISFVRPSVKPLIPLLGIEHTRDFHITAEHSIQTLLQKA